ncbi:unnamed protein product [Toxocara canis]|uniref:Uncharacterized protein n=1 Tax=Toxocara canis TaxID=6265 RepID=A0A183UPH3_TOXCA|nr:unnamed protein product [Toxocara canis]
MKMHQIRPNQRSKVNHLNRARSMSISRISLVKNNRKVDVQQLQFVERSSH